MSEHRTSFEKGNADADLLELQRRLESLRAQNEQSTGGVCRGSGDGMYVQETRRNTGNPSSQEHSQTGSPRGRGRAEMGGGQARSSPEAANPRRVKGPELKRSEQRRDGQEIGESLVTPETVQELQQSLPKRRNIQTSGSIASTINSTAATSSPTHGASAGQTEVLRAYMVRVLKR